MCERDREVCDSFLFPRMSEAHKKPATVSKVIEFLLINRFSDVFILGNIM